MPRPPNASAGIVEATLQSIRDTKSEEELRALQAVLLPLLGCSLEVTAQAVGRDRFWVSRTRNRVLRDGPLVVRHGGRRRETVTKEQEVALVNEALDRATLRWGGMPALLRDALREVVDAVASERYVDESTLTGILNRSASQIVPKARGADLKELALDLRFLHQSLCGIRRVMKRFGRW